MAMKIKRVDKFKREDTSSYWGKNKSTKNLKGERWKPVPGLEDTHEVSNYGRFRCLDKLITPSGKSPYLRKGHLMSPQISASPNYFKKDFTYHAVISVETKERVFHFSIRRLVYHCFREPIELEDGKSPKELIIPKDGNGLNTYYKNLIKVSKSDVEKLIYQRKRIPDTLKKLSKEKRAEMANKARPKRYKAVTQYDKNGKKQAFYNSLSEASKLTGISVSLIGSCVKGRIQSAGGYIWRYGNGPAKISTEWLNQKMKNYIQRKSKLISKYSLKGALIAVYPSIREASRATGIKHGSISACLAGRLESAWGFVWREGKGRSKIKLELKPYRIGLIQYNERRKKIKEFKSINQASLETGIAYHKIRAALINNLLLEGFYWSYANET